MARHHKHPKINYQLNDDGRRLYQGTKTPLGEDEYEACPYCYEHAGHGYDGISICNGCDICIEGDSIILSYDEREKIDKFDDKSWKSVLKTRS